MASPGALRALWVVLALLAPRQDPEQLWDEGRRLEAIAVLAERVAAAPDDGDLRLRLVRCEIAVHRYAAALEHAGPLGPGGRRERGLALFRLARYEEALAHLDRGTADDVLMVVDALEALGRMDAADAAVDDAARLCGAEDTAVLVLLGRRHDRHGRSEQAVAAFERALAADPVNGEALFGLGRSLVRAGRREQGLAVLERHRALVKVLDRLDEARRAVDLAPLHAPNHAALGDVERQLGRTDRAEAAYEQAYELAQDDELAVVALRLARLLREDRGNVDAAVELLRSAGERTGDPRPWVRAGDYRMEQGRAPEALRHYHEAERIRPGEARIRARIERARELEAGG